MMIHNMAFGRCVCWWIANKMHVTFEAESQVGRVSTQLFVDRCSSIFFRMGCNDHQLPAECQCSSIEFFARIGYIERRKRVISVGLSVPTEVHVNHSVAVETVGYPRMSTGIVACIARDIEGKTFSKFVLYNLQEIRRAFVLLGYHGYIVVEICA